MRTFRITKFDNKWLVLMIQKRNVYIVTVMEVCTTQEAANKKLSLYKFIMKRTTEELEVIRRKLNAV